MICSKSDFVPTHRNHRATVQHDVVAGRVFVRVICRPLEHRAVYDASTSPVAAGGDGYPVSTIETIEMTHAWDVNGRSPRAARGRCQARAGWMKVLGHPRVNIRKFNREEFYHAGEDEHRTYQAW